jgi:hypothetical protein
LDGDGDLDVFAAHSSDPNQVWRRRLGCLRA